MNLTRRAATVGSLGMIAGTALGSPARADVGEAPSGQVGTDAALDIAVDAYVYGYSLITTEVTRVQTCNVPKIEGLRGPMGQFINVKRYPPADYRGVSAPNADTLYSFAFVDLSEPQVLSHPNMGRRYYLFELTDLWMIDFETPGARTAGGAAANYLLTGPGWSGTVPAGMKHIRAATRYIAVIGRTYADGTDQDYQIVNDLQAKYAIVPLSAYGKPYTPPPGVVDPNPGFSMTEKPQVVIDNMDTSFYFNMLARLMSGAAPPASEDGPILARMAKIGIVPGNPFDLSKLDTGTQAALKDVGKAGFQRIAANRNMLGERVNNWVITKGLGIYGTDYLKRAVVAAYGWPANRQEDAVYPYTDVDSSGQTLNGAYRYTLTFPKEQQPPVNGFWSITMYEIDRGWWFVPNPLNKFTVSPRNNLKANADGSVTLQFQNGSPGTDQEANWLPAPKGDFILMLRMYWPKPNTPSVLNGTWKPPGVDRVA
ncbi:MAG: DUF1254 domain-containing protein [Acetobacteraceae bacterium]|nr:DUF1254 domain-containing protein [Acetobacteraceae bacterium]